MVIAADLDMTPYPVQLDVSCPPHFDRIQLLIRVLLYVILGWLGITMGAITGILYLALPVIAAIMVSVRDREGYQQWASQKLWPVLSWLVAFFAYMLLLTDRLPIDHTRELRVEVRTTGRPTVGSALLRLVFSIPSAVVWGLLGIVSGVLWLVAAVTVLVHRTVPHSILTFQAGYVRWYARLLAYHASLVEEYPPFALHDRPSAAPASMAAP